MKETAHPSPTMAIVFEQICKRLAASDLSDLELERRTGVSAKTIKKLASGEYMPKTIQGLIAVETALVKPLPPLTGERAS